MNTKILVQFNSQYPQQPTQSEIEQWATLVFSALDIHGEVSINICDEAEIQQFNLKFRHKDKATNVLSFPFENPPGIDINIIGDILICTPIVAAEAQAQNKSFQAHFAHMVIHGILHCLGYDHIADDEAQQMESLEIKLLKQLGFDDPYGEHKS